MGWTDFRDVHELCAVEADLEHQDMDEQHRGGCSKSWTVGREERLRSGIRRDESGFTSKTDETELDTESHKFGAREVFDEDEGDESTSASGRKPAYLIDELRIRSETKCSVYAWAVVVQYW